MYNPILQNNGFGYMPYQNAAQTSVVSQVQIPKVHGEDGARAYVIGPNSSVLLLDETDNIVWCKSTDAGGYATLIGYRITPIEKEEHSKEEYVSVKDFNSLKDKVDKLVEDLNG